MFTAYNARILAFIYLIVYIHSNTRYKIQRDGTLSHKPTAGQRAWPIGLKVILTFRILQSFNSALVLFSFLFLLINDHIFFREFKLNSWYGTLKEIKYSLLTHKHTPRHGRGDESCGGEDVGDTAQHTHSLVSQSQPTLQYR